jgi:hypothetical protein
MIIPKNIDTNGTILRELASGNDYLNCWLVKGYLGLVD